MMSNCAFWSSAGELVALYGADGADPVVAFGAWARDQELGPGRLIRWASASGLPAVSRPGWQRALAVGGRRKGSWDDRLSTTAPVAVVQADADPWASQLIPGRFVHERFVFRAQATRVLTCQLEALEVPDGWYAALGPNDQTGFLVRIVPVNGRLPGPGWRSALVHSLRQGSGWNLRPLIHPPTNEALTRVAAWEYQVEAGPSGAEAAWHIQAFPGRGLLREWSGGLDDPWQATALLRWLRPGIESAAVDDSEALNWTALFRRWSVADARLVVQNVLLSRSGGLADAAAVIFDRVEVQTGDGKRLVRHRPHWGLPVAELRELFGNRTWRELERIKTQLPPGAERRTLADAVMVDLDQRLVEGRLALSSEGVRWWTALVRQPWDRRAEQELNDYQSSSRWAQVLGGDPRRAEALFRRLDVTDFALCLRQVPDRRWRRFVTARRQAEVEAELEFCRQWQARGELTWARQLDAWRSWDAILDDLPLTEALD